MMKMVMRIVLMVSLAAATMSCKAPSSAAEGPALVRIRLGEKWGFVDPAGVMKIDHLFDSVSAFSKDGLAIACTGGEKCHDTPGTGDWGVIDTSGKFVVKPTLKALQFYSEGLAPACWEATVPHTGGKAQCLQWEGKWGFMDRSGKAVIEPRFMAVRGFSEDRAAVCVANCDPWGNGKWGYIDKAGNEIVAPQYDQVGRFTDGLAPVRRGGRWGYLSRNGEIVIPLQFAQANQFNEGMAQVCLGEVTDKDQRCGYIERSGRYVINPQFVEARPLIENRAAVRIGEQWGFIDRTGTVVVPPRYARVEDFSDGLAAFCPELVQYHCRWGFIDAQGATVIHAQFDEVGSFRHGVTLVVLHVSNGSRTGLIDKRGQYLVNPR